MYTVEFDDKERIMNINSNNGESIPLERPVPCLGGVEVNFDVQGILVYYTR